MVGNLGSAAVGAAGGIAGGLINGIFSQIAANQQYKRQIEFWKMENAYNTPSAQRDRLLAAGFNPSAAMEQVAGNNTAGELSNVPGNEVAKNGILDPRAITDWFHAFADLENTVAGTQHLTAQVGTELTKQLINTLEASGIKIDNETKKVLYKYADNQQRAQLDKLAAETEAAKAGAKLSTEQATTESETRELKKGNIVADTDVKKSQSDNLASATALIDKQVDWFDTNAELARQQILANIEKLSQETKNLIIKGGQEALLFKREDFTNSVNQFVGFDINSLPTGVQSEIKSIYSTMLREKASPKLCLLAIQGLVQRASKRDTYIEGSWSASLDGILYGGSGSGTFDAND